MTHYKFYRREDILLGLILFFSITCFFTHALPGVESKDDETSKMTEKQEKLEKEIATARREVEKWDKILYNRRHWAVRSEKAERQAEIRVAKAKKLLEQKEKELAELRQEQLLLKQKKEKELALKNDYISAEELKLYERKSLFIFPIFYKESIDPGLLTDKRKTFLSNLMSRMFVTDFKRINFFDVKSNDSIDTFLQDAHAYMRKNVKEITVKRMKPDGKFKEAMVTSKDLLKTTENSFAIVPFFDSLEKEKIEEEDKDKEKKSTRYVYKMAVHFDIYNTKTKEKIKTLKINNKKDWLGILSSVSGSLQADNSDFEGLPEKVKEDEEKFRNAIAGLLLVLKKEMKKMPEFIVLAPLSMTSHSRFGFDMGHDTGIKIDHRYKIYVSQADGGKKMTGFGKIRKVEASYSEAQTLLGRPQEGDQIEEDPKVGINVVGGLGMAPLHINLEDDVAAGSHLCLFLGAEYELGPILRLSELYTALNLRIGLPRLEETYADAHNLSQLFVNVGIVKKIYFRRLALNFGGYIGLHSATLTANSIDTKGSSFGFTLNAGIEAMITPSLSAFGGVNLDLYPDPSKYENNGTEIDLPDGWEWNAKGVSLNLGAKVTF